MALILASQSPRRKALLEAAGVAFTVATLPVTEEFRPDEPTRDAAIRLATEKAGAVAQRHPTAWVLAADTIVALDGEPFGKPADAQEAHAMLRRLSGRDHVVVTGVVVCRGATVRSMAVQTEVRFRALGDDDIARYVATGESFDKAGGYGIQGHGAALIDTVRGSYTNVVGLPLPETLALISVRGGAHVEETT